MATGSLALELVQHGLGPYVTCFESCSAEDLAELDDSVLKRAFGIANATDRARILAVVRARLLLASKIARQLDQLSLGAEVVDLSAAGVDDATAARFAEALCSNATLHVLALSLNDLGDESAAAFASSLTMNSTLTSLDLSCNRISDQGAQALASALSSAEAGHTVRRKNCRLTRVAPSQ